MTRRAYLLLAFLLAFTAGLVILLVIYVADAKAWTSYPANRHIYNSEAVLSGGGTITDRSGVILAQTVDGKRVYNSKAEIRKAVLHMVGDSDGFIRLKLVCPRAILPEELKRACETVSGKYATA